MDEIQRIVEKSVSDLRKANTDEEKLNAVTPITTIPIIDILGELTIQIEDIVVAKGAERLISMARLPLPPRPEELIKAIFSQDLEELHTYADGKLVVLINTLLLLLISIQETSERIDNL